MTPYPAAQPPTVPSVGVGTPGTAETGTGPPEEAGIDDETAGWALRRIAALEAECAAYVDLLGSIHLHIRWRHVTRQLTTEQKRLFADAVDLDAQRGDEPPVAERWWDWPTCEVCQAPVEARGGFWFDIHGRAGQDQPVNWAGVGPTPTHAHTPARVRAEIEQAAT